MTEGTNIPVRRLWWGFCRRSGYGGLSAEVAVGGGLILALVLFSWIGPLLDSAHPRAIHAHHILAQPALAFWLGTDDLGRDLLARMMRGGQPTLAAGFLGALIAVLVGASYGLLSALGPRWLDRLLMRLLDAVLAIPTLVLMIFFAAIIPLNITSLILLLGLVAWPALARLVRNEALAHAHRDYVLAARQFGASRFYIARVHLLRAMLPVLAVNATFLVADLILALSGLSFLGLGIQPPHASWGGILDQGARLAVAGAWWLIVFPGAAIFLAILAMNMLGQGLLARWEGRS